MAIRPAPHYHEELINGVSSQMKEILDNSDQAIYIYLDDGHKVCNSKFASILGYSCPEEWAKLRDPLPATIAENSRSTVVEAYQRAMEKMMGSALKITLKHKSGKTFDTEMIMVPIAYKGQKLAMHFIQT